MTIHEHTEQVVLVDEHDNETGAIDKLQAHQQGVLHRALSVFIFNGNNELLLQQRAAGKYHSALLWTNTCCSHPRPGEAVADAAVRRLREEMGIACPLQKAFSFTYKAALENGLTEHEYDHVFTGTTDSLPHADAAEAAAWRYAGLTELRAEIAAAPQLFTPWFRICIADWHYQLFNRNQSS